MNWKAVLAGALGLIAVQRLGNTSTGPAAVRGIGAFLSTGVQRFLDPNAPLWSAAVIAKAGGGAPKAAPKKSSSPLSAGGIAKDFAGSPLIGPGGNAIVNLFGG